MEIKKSKKANIDQRRIVYLQVGFVAALALVLVAFEWSAFSKEERNEEVVEMALNTPEMIPVIELQKPEPKPQPKEEQNSEEFIIVKKKDDDNKIILPPKKHDTLDFNDTNIVIGLPPVDPPDTNDWSKIFEVVEDNPKYPGGLEKLYAFMGKETRYPGDARSLGIQGKVYVSFVVDTDGSVSEVKTLNNLFPSCDKEAKRVIRKMKKWTPGKQRGRAVKVRMTLPIVFRLK